MNYVRSCCLKLGALDVCGVSFLLARCQHHEPYMTPFYTDGQQRSQEAHDRRLLA